MKMTQSFNSELCLYEASFFCCSITFVIVCGLLIGCFLFNFITLVSARDRDQCSQKSEQPGVTAAAIGFKNI